MEIEPIARFCSPFTSKFGIPRQSGVVPELRGRIVMLPPYNSADPLRGLDGYDYLWLIWGFSANEGAAKHLTVRPPRLGGNERMGVFATRSPFRPNNIGLSAVKIESINLEAKDGPEICVSGADLMDGTPIYDIKPYIAFTDSHAEARSGIVDSEAWSTLAVADPDGRPGTHAGAGPATALPRRPVAHLRHAFRPMGSALQSLRRAAYHRFAHTHQAVKTILFQT